MYRLWTYYVCLIILTKLLFNKTGKTLALDDHVHSFQNLQNLNREHVNEILKREIKFQGRAGATLSDLIDETMYSYIKTVDIINILLENYNIGKELHSVTNYYIPRCLSNLLISYHALNCIKDEIFLVEDVCRHIETVAKKENLKFAYLEDTNFEDIGQTNIFIINKPEEFERFQDYNKTVHYLVTFNDDYLVWKRSYGNTQNIKIHQDEEMLNSIVTEDKIYSLSHLTTMIVACPGMGKSTLMNRLAQHSPLNKWVLKVDMRNHNTYYENCKNQNKRNFNSTELLNYFKESSSNELEKKIYDRLLTTKDILILMDGFDEASVSYMDQVTAIAEAFYNDTFQICLTTRPIMKSHLENTFNVLAMHLLPFNYNDQMMFLSAYLRDKQKLDLEVSLCKLVMTFRKSISNYGKDSDAQFTEVPLHMEMLVELFCDKCENDVSNDKVANLDENFDLINLYKQFIDRKNQIMCRKFNSKAAYDLFQDYQSVLALKVLFPPYDVEIDACLSDITKSANDYTKLLEQGGILTVDDGLNIGFVHQSFAEYLAAEWLFKNLNNENKKVKSAIDSIFTLYYSNYSHLNYLLLLKTFCSLAIENDFQGDQSLKAICLDIISGRVHQLKEKLFSNHANFTCTDQAGRSVLHLLVIFGKYYPDMVHEVFHLVLEKTLNICEDKFGFNPIDYALDSDHQLYGIADVMCEKWPNIKISIVSDEDPTWRWLIFESEHSQMFQQYTHLFKLLEAYNAYNDALCNIPHKGWIYILSHQINPSHKVPAISEPQGLDIYKKNDLSYQVILNGLETIKESLRTNNAINKKTFNGNTPLHFAVLLGKLDIIDLLLTKGADTNISNLIGQTPLVISVIDRNMDAFERLLPTANVNIRGPSGTVQFSILHLAVGYGQTEMIKLILVKDVNAHLLEDRDGLTPLHLAVSCDPLGGFGEFPDSKKIIAMVDVFLRHQVDINVTNSRGETPLHCRIRTFCSTVCSLLNFGRGIPYYNEHQLEHLKLVDYLLSKNADMSTLTWKTSLHVAVKYSDYQIATKLIDQKAEINAQDNQGNTPLHTLLKKQEPNQKRYVENMLRDYSKLLDLLLSAENIDINVVNGDGDSPLHFSIKYRDYSATKMLISKHADVNIQNKAGETPLCYAARFGNDPKIIDLLSNMPQVKM